MGKGTLRHKHRPDPTVRDRVYLRNLRMLLLFMMGLIVITALALLYNFDRIASHIVFSDALSLMEQTKVSIETIINSAQMLTLQISQDSGIKHLRLHNPPTEQEKAVNLEQLARYQHIMKPVDSIYLYNLRSGKLYTSRVMGQTANTVVSRAVFPDRQALNILDAYQSYPAYRPIPRVVSIPGEIPHNYYTFLGYGLMDKMPDRSLASAVVVNISVDWVRAAAIEKKQSIGETLILDKNGIVVSHSPAYPMLTALGQTGPFPQLLQDEDSGYLTDWVGDTRVFLAYTAPDMLGWRYVRMIPYTTILKDVSTIRLYTVLIALALLLVGLFLVWLLNRAVYKPIVTYKASLEDLHAKERENAYRLRQDLLRHLLQERSMDITQEMRTALARYSVGVQDPASYYVAVIKIDRYAHLSSLYAPEERALYRFAVLNIAEELMGEAGFLAMGTQMGGAEMALIVTRSGNPDTKDLPILISLLGKLRDATQTHLSFSISSTLSTAGDSLISLNALYAQASERIQGRLFAGYGCVLPPLPVDDVVEAAFQYPEEKERQMLEAAGKARADVAKRLYREMIEECGSLSYPLFSLTLSRLALNINRAYRAGLPAGSPASDILVLSPVRIEVKEDLHRLFDAALDTIVQQAEQGGNRADALAAAIEEQIVRQYMNPLLSIELIADSLSMSASYIGRVYTKKTGLTIVDRITRQRISRACQLLAHTREHIASIAQAVGFTNESYFFRVFKRETGMTPAAYRRQNVNTSLQNQ